MRRRACDPPRRHDRHPDHQRNNGGASGSSALYHARQAVLCGEAECALAVGFDEMRPGGRDRVVAASPDPLSRHPECAATSISFGAAERSLPPALRLFGAQLEWMARELGVGDAAFATVAVNSRAHAQHNPYAIFRDPLTPRGPAAPWRSRRRRLGFDPAAHALNKVATCMAGQKSRIYRRE
jgi:acetyl-CoA acetyltransferase